MCPPRVLSFSYKELLDQRPWSGVDLWLSLFSGGHPGGVRVNTWGGLLFLHLRTLSPLGPGTSSTFKEPLSQPPPPAFISMQAQAAQTQGDCSLCMPRVGGWELGPHTLAGPGCRGAGLPHPMSPDRLCPPSYSPHSSPPASISIA